MSQIHNSVYGLALGDAFGFITERMRFPAIVEKYGNGRFLPMDKTLPVSDDTQMSIITIDALQEYQRKYLFTPDSKDAFFNQHRLILMKHFLEWNATGNPRGAGKATLNSLKSLAKSDKSDPHAFADEESKGSGTVMRAPWVGLSSVVSDEMLLKFSWEHSLITHRSPSTAYSAYLTSLITRKIFRGELECGFIREFALSTIDNLSNNFIFPAEHLNDLEEIWNFISRIELMPKGWAMMSSDDVDICDYTGQQGRGDMVLAGAIAVADAFGADDPIQGIQRAMLTGGDSDTIGAVAGAFIGAAHEDDIWEDLPDILEDDYRDKLDNTISYLELNS